MSLFFLFFAPGKLHGNGNTVAENHNGNDNDDPVNAETEIEDESEHGNDDSGKGNPASRSFFEYRPDRQRCCQDKEKNQRTAFIQP